MINQAVFNLVKQKYDYWSSWAIGDKGGASPKSKVGNLSVFWQRRHKQIDRLT